MRVFLDANVLFSAAKTDGAARRLLGMMVAAGHGLVADEYVVAEARRNLAAKGAGAKHAFDALLSQVEVARFRHGQLPPDLVALVPEKDRPVMAAAIRLRCDALMTGDATHFGRLHGSVRHGVAIHSPRSLAQALNG